MNRQKTIFFDKMLKGGETNPSVLRDEPKGPTRLADDKEEC